MILLKITNITLEFGRWVKVVENEKGGCTKGGQPGSPAENGYQRN